MWHRKNGMKNIVDLALRQVALMRVMARLWLRVLQTMLCFMSKMFTLQSEDLNVFFKVGFLSKAAYITAAETRLLSSDYSS